MKRLKKLSFNSFFDCIIYLNGDISQTDINFLISNNEHISSNFISVIATDGIYNKLKNFDLNINFIIGDMDSVDKKNIEHLLPNNTNIKIVKKLNQNKFDFEKALDFAIKNNFHNILIFGINGGEYEHSLNNWSILIKYSEKLNLCCYTKNRYGILISDSIDANLKKGEIVSIIPINQTIISTEGFEWKLSNCKLELGKKEGARNKTIKENVKIILHSGKYFLFIDSRFPFSITTI